MAKSIDQLKKICGETPENLEARLELVNCLRKLKHWEDLHYQTWELLDEHPTNQDVVKEFIDTHSYARVITVEGENKGDLLYVLSPEGVFELCEIPIERVSHRVTRENYDDYLNLFDDEKGGSNSYLSEFRFHQSKVFPTRNDVVVIREPNRGSPAFRHFSSRSGLLLEYLVPKKSKSLSWVDPRECSTEFGDAHYEIKKVVSLSDRDAIIVHGRGIMKWAGMVTSIEKVFIENRTFYWSKVLQEQWHLGNDDKTTSIGHSFSYRGDLATQVHDYEITNAAHRRPPINTNWVDREGTVFDDQKEVQLAFDLLHGDLIYGTREIVGNVAKVCHQPLFPESWIHGEIYHDIGDKTYRSKKGEFGGESTYDLLGGHKINSSSISQHLYERLKRRFRRETKQIR